MAASIPELLETIQIVTEEALRAISEENEADLRDNVNLLFHHASDLLHTVRMM